ncbi:MAG: hypothetical protein IPM25_00310 [Chloracidobacterium sp.]|nr:hypothetical protein [Chloracidobacterium sp.]
MIGSARILAILVTMQFAFIASCISVLLATPAQLEAASLTATPQTRTDCDDPATGWKIENLNGKVRSFREEEIEHRIGSGEKKLVKVVTFGPTGEYLTVEEPYSLRDYTKSGKIIFIFDKECRVLERRDPKRSWLIADASRTVYSYTPSGTLKEEAIYDLEGRLEWKSVALLDKNQRIIGHRYTSQEHPEHFNPKRYDVYKHYRSTYKLDAAGNQIEEISYNWEGKLYATYKRAYDASKRLTRELRLDHKERPINLVIYSFDEGGLLREELKYNSSGYSDLDVLIPGTLDSGFGKFQDGYRIIYEYDKSNNWIKKTEFDLAGKGKLSRVTYRTYVYY